MSDLPQYLAGDTAVKIAASIEQAVRRGDIAAGERLPTVRGLADHLGVSPATVAAAFRSLRTRGVIQAEGRRGTRVAHRPLPPARRARVVPRGARDLADGNPDPALLPPLGPALQRIDAEPVLYGAPPHHRPLVELVSKQLRDEGVTAGEICVVHGAMDGIERLLAEHLRPGDRVAVEDPGFSGILELVASRGHPLLPVAIDEQGPRPDELERACREGAAAFIVTPRAQSPTGAALSEARAGALRRVLRGSPGLLLIEDDHASAIAGAPLHCLHTGWSGRWAHVHSFSKFLCPDLRLAVMTGDEKTMTAVQDRLIVGERWVSHLLQRLAHKLLSDRTVQTSLRRAERTYTERRTALITALRAVGLRPWGRSGYNVWLPVAEETATAQTLAAAGWAIAAGERFRLRTPPGVRITAATLEPTEAEGVAQAFAEALARRSMV